MKGTTKEQDVPFTRLTDEDLAEVFSIIDTEETQDNGDEGTEEQPPPEAYAFGD